MLIQELQLPITGRSTMPAAKCPVELDERIGVVEIMGRRRTAPMLVLNDVDFPLTDATTPNYSTWK
ncbi:MAG: hypothetical protein RXQ97_06640 [Caldivirga sp.]